MLYLLDPGSPNLVSVLGNASARCFVLTWSPPGTPNGVPRYYFVYYKPIDVRQVRDVDEYKRLNVTAKWANLTMLTPFTQYSVEVAAVNVRSHDGQVLEGQRSTAIVANTAEDGKFLLYTTSIFLDIVKTSIMGMFVDLFQKTLEDTQLEGGIIRLKDWSQSNTISSLEEPYTNCAC